MSSVPPAKGRRWEAFARSVIAEHAGICHVCGHAGALQLDHLEPVTERPELTWIRSNCRPAHGVSVRRNPCPVCSPQAGRPVYCNQLRGGLSVDRARRIIAEWIEANQGAPPRARTAPEPGSGRDWG
jgi:hypothetical protein